MAFVKIVNAEGGSDARYDVNQATPEERAQLDGEGRPLSSNLPDQWTWTSGLPGARGGGSPSDMGGGGSGGGGDLTASPYYQQYQSQIQAANAADLSSTKSALQQLLIKWGMIPEGFQDKYGALDDATKGLIEKNTQTGVSDYARYLESKQDAQRTALQNLAKRGLTRSGAKGYALRRGALDSDRSLADNLSSVLQNANTLQTGYAGREQERQTGLASLLAQLASQASFNNSFRASQVGAPAPQGAPQDNSWYQVTENADIPSVSTAMSNYNSAYYNNPKAPAFNQNPLGSGYYNKAPAPTPSPADYWKTHKAPGM